MPPTHAISGGEQLRREIDAVDYWWHSIDLGHGVVTPGHKKPAMLQAELASLDIPDLYGKSVLDIGAWDGFYSFSAEALHAARVVALDHYVWSLDLLERDRYWKECKQRGTEPPANAEGYPFWRPDALPGKRGFDLAHRALSSRVESVVGDFMTVDLERLGTFDVVLYLGVLYHMQDPFHALRRLAAVTRERAIIETLAVFVRGAEDRSLWEFYEGSEIGDDATNWWAPNMRALSGMCRAAGFSRVEIKSGPRRAFALSRQRVNYYRAIIHAIKTS